MQITVTGRHMPVSDALRDYAEEKVGKVAKIHNRDDMVVEIVLHEEKNPANKNKDVAEVTARMKGVVVRAEEAAPDMFAAIDLVSAKLETQMRKYKDRLRARANGKGHHTPEITKTAPGDSLEPSRFEESMPAEAQVVKTKDVDLKPMTDDEAIMQLELLGHDFMLFQQADTELVSVLYRRNDGDYGVIRPSKLT